MKYTRAQFTNEYYKLWELGLLISVAKNASVYSVKYRKNNFDQYSRVTLNAVSVSDALERACYAITYASPWRPEDIDLHAVYDSEENLLWIDEPFYEIVQKKNEFRGIERREFLAKFGMTSAAILFGLGPLRALAGTTTTALSGTASGFHPVGEQLYTSAGSFSWTAPANVTIVNAVAIGGTADSSFINTATVKGGGGTSAGGTYTGDGGGNGGTTGTYSANDSGYWAGPGGGGAGGYAGNGGAGGNGSGDGATQGHSRGGGGGGVGLYGQGASGSGSASGSGGGGGGGYGGVVDSQGAVGNGGSGGAAGSSSSGGAYGGGAGWLTTNGAGGGGGLGYKNNISTTPGNSYTVTVGTGGSVTNSGTHGSGAVRIIWGAGRSFPSSAS